jgi:N-acyl-D-amino-acid deacylase
VYDLDKLTVEEPEFLHDAGHDSRLVQRASGDRWIMVNGEVTFEDGKDTNAYSGQLVRC